jgi:hypothetical protein
MKISQILRLPITVIMTVLSMAIGVMLFPLITIGLLGGALKEAFNYFVSSQTFSTKSTLFSQDEVNVLVVPE